jgi:hypothetical protein
MEVDMEGTTRVVIAGHRPSKTGVNTLFPGDPDEAGNAVPT